jgi:ABC-type branched-subunit amino acid transport system permease subunit
VPNTYIVSSVTIVMIFVVMATGLDLMMGYAG